MLFLDFLHNAHPLSVADVIHFTHAFANAVAPVPLGIGKCSSPSAAVKWAHVRLLHDILRP
jgi:hypothetical protein